MAHATRHPDDRRARDETIVESLVIPLRVRSFRLRSLTQDMVDATPKNGPCSIVYNFVSRANTLRYLQGLIERKPHPPPGGDKSTRKVSKHKRKGGKR
jgi:hypothetical protein